MKLNFFHSEKLDNFSETVRSIFNTSEPGIVLFIPKTDRERRIEQLIQDFQFETPLKLLYLNSQIVDGIVDVEAYIQQKFPLKETEKINIVVLKSELAVLEKSIGFLDALVNVNKKNNRYRFLFTSEIDLTHPSICDQFSSHSDIFTNIYYYSMYSKEDSVSFLNHLCSEWRFTVNKETIDHIVQKCGGHFWLLKETLRSLYVNPHTTVEEILRNEATRFRLEQIYFSLLDSERSVLKKIILKQNIDEEISETHSYHYLKRMKLIVDDKISIQILEDFIKSYIPKSSIAISKNHVIVNNVIVDSHFSRKEFKAIRALLSRPNILISRDELAKAIWPIDTESHFSEWAIDRIIARLRKKLSLLSLEEHIIKTVRSKGYIINP